MDTKLSIIIGLAFVFLIPIPVFAEQVPEPAPEYPVPENCGLGTTYQDGGCMAIDGWVNEHGCLNTQTFDGKVCKKNQSWGPNPYQSIGNVGSDYYDNLSPEELEDMQKRRIGEGGANPDRRNILVGPNIPSSGQSYDGLILVFLIIGISISFILGMIYWWRKK